MASLDKIEGEAVEAVALIVLVVMLIICYYAFRTFAGSQLSDLLAAFKNAWDAMAGSKWGDGQFSWSLPGLGDVQNGGPDVVSTGTNQGNDDPTK